MDQKFWNEFQTLTRSLANLIDITAEGFTNGSDHEKNKKRYDLLNRVVGESKEDRNENNEDADVCQSQYEYWNDPIFNKYYEDLERTLAKKAELKKMDFQFSFDMGFEWEKDEV